MWTYCWKVHGNKNKKEKKVGLPENFTGDGEG